MEDFRRLFHPLISEWFSSTYGKPTDIQVKAWKHTFTGHHILLTAPTGSGKTLAAFLAGLNQLITGTWSHGKVRILYISPLKALNNDIRVNLLKPLSELKHLFATKGESFPDIRVFTRSGDTPQSERRKMVSHPPEILITTPESLNLILSSPRSRMILDSLEMVILDEIHAILGTKRGTHTITAIDRLSTLSGEFLRIGLSATVKPLGMAAPFLGGFRILKRGNTVNYEAREVQVISSTISKAYEVKVEYPGNMEERLIDGSIYPALIEELKSLIQWKQSTLVFTNSRKMSEKITRMINEGEDEIIATAHHGSLSKELRAVVEERLKRGDLKAIVATSSLELGIDIGALDQVVLVEAPFSISSGIQRSGRAGHGVNETSRSIIYPLYGMDLVHAAVAARRIMDQDIEATKVPESPLDVLAQIIISMVSIQDYSKEELFGIIRSSYPYRNLTEGSFDRLLSMLAGRYADTRIRELEAAITWDRLDNRIRGKSGSLMRLYLSGGTIPDRGYYTLRIMGSGAKIGELDEEFVWERSVGDLFTLGNQTWRIRKIDHQNVEVVPEAGKGSMAPFWKGEPFGRDFTYSESIGNFLEEINALCEDEKGEEKLIASWPVSKEAAERILAFADLQKKLTRKPLPSRYRLLIEHLHDPGGLEEDKHVILHTLWGGKVNAPFSIALSQAWEEQYGYSLKIFFDDDSIMINLPNELEMRELLSMVTAGNIEALLRKKLESTGFFGGRFRENAGRALLLPKRSFKQRMPLWMTRMKSKKLLEGVRKYEDFPILAETWRSCLEDDFDLDALSLVLDELTAGTIEIVETNTYTPSPFAAGTNWSQTNQFMYEDDTPQGSSPSALRQDVIQEVLTSRGLTIPIPEEIITEFVSKLQRTWPDYSPGRPDDLLDHLKERLLIPIPEWQKLLDTIQRDHTDLQEIIKPIKGKHLTFRLPGGSIDCVISQEILKLHPGFSEIKNGSISGIIQDDQLEVFLTQWLGFYGPLDIADIQALFGVETEKLLIILSEMKEEGILFLDREGGNFRVCDAENLEILLRMKRMRGRKSFEALPLDHLQPFLAQWQGITERGGNLENLRESLEKLFGYPAPAAAWEEEILPARLSHYYPHWLDSLFQNSSLIWAGREKGNTLFCFEEDIDLFLPQEETAAGETPKEPSLFTDKNGRYGFWDIQQSTGLPSGKLTELLWSQVWQGRISNDSYTTLRRGIENGFRAESAAAGRNRPRSRRGFRGWEKSRPLAGNWFILRRIAPEDLFEQEQAAHERVRQLLQRYGILFRQLLNREIPELRWAPVFRILRRMELSGEVLGGHFFKGISGLQFADPGAVRMMEKGLPEDSLYFINAADPASLCGRGIEELKGTLPSRLPTTHLVFRGVKLLLTSKRKGRDLTFHIPPDDPKAVDAMFFFKELLGREINPMKAVRVEEINGESVFQSPYRQVLYSAGFRSDLKAYILRL
jgi:ATP-dependent Lhr-like helicase